MSIIEAIILGLIQGLTEFIPVSSSGHLVIAHHLLGINDIGLTFDVALHIGTLMALLVFFHKDLKDLALSLVRKSPRTRISWLLVVATIPAVVDGVLLEGLAQTTFRSLKLVAVNLIVVGGIMMLAERYAKRFSEPSDFDKVTRKQAITMGLAQAAAIIPGVSRSGSTISAGIFSGLSRVAAARFSFLLAVPITLGAIMKTLLEREALTQISQQAGLFAIGILTALVSGLVAIKYLLKFLSKNSLDVFAYYRFALGAVILAAVLFGGLR